MYTGPDRAEDDMDSLLDVKEALVARSKTASLDDLRSQGRRQVKVIRAEHIAAMVREAVQKAVEHTGMISREEVDKLVDRSQDEFRQIIQEREQQLSHAREAMRQLEETKAERIRLQASLQDVVEDRSRIRDDFDTAIEECDRLRQRVAELENLLSSQPDPVSSEPAASGASADLMLRLMNEVAELKANMLSRPADSPTPTATASAASAGADAGLTAAIDKLAGSLNDRLEKFGRKMGISSAVDARDLNFDGLFAKESDQKLESNMDSVQVKKKTEGSIHANLERLRKLKGDG